VGRASLLVCTSRDSVSHNAPSICEAMLSILHNGSVLLSLGLVGIAAVQWRNSPNPPQHGPEVRLLRQGHQFIFAVTDFGDGGNQQEFLRTAKSCFTAT